MPSTTVLRGLVLLVPLLTTACSQTLISGIRTNLDNPRNMQNMSVRQIEKALTERICAEAWQPSTYSSRDTPETIDGNRANNRARDAFCRD